LGDDEQALQLARRAVSLDPDLAMAHWCLGTLLCDRNRLDDAMSCAEQAVALDSTDPRPHALVAQIHAKKGKWVACLDSAGAGLALDPSDETCLGLRALAMRAKETGGDWSRALNDLVEENPASAWARTGLGWSALETGLASEAQTHFEQALALDPTAGWARDGLIEALKARNPVYSAVLQFFLWIDRLPPRTKWIYFLGGWFGYRFLRVTLQTNPGLAPVAYPLMALWVFFLVVSWTSGPLSDFVLSRTAEGRRLVTGERLVGANLVTGLLGLSVLAGIISISVDSERATLAALCFVFLVIPVSAVFQCVRGWPRKIMLTYASVAALMALVALGAPLESAWVLAFIVVLMSALGSWLAAFLRNRLPAT
jgi:hypothetical protein